ncbi:MAG: DUF3604 domain-containing protein [Acidobacteriota bacterium]|nr:DUF3604 domain-containing protein [Acidobacteriota bacterium]
MSRVHRLLATAALLAALAGCGVREPARAPAGGTAEMASEPDELRRVFFGDLHVHTALSIDAFITNTRTLPDDAYRYAKGEEIDHVSGQKIRIDRPLDFMAVTDHAELLGVARAMDDPDDPLSGSPLAANITSDDYETSHAAFRGLVATAAASAPGAGTVDPELAAGASRDAWQHVIEAADSHYDPGQFTTFVAYEWSSMPGLANLHRNVVFAGSDAPELPYSSAQSVKPEDLWAFLDAWRDKGNDVLAIPHNSNASKGLMYPLEDSFGEPIGAEHASQRMRNEPITEITQFKGTSETHTVLAPLDEFAGFELWNTTVGAPIPIEPVPGSYVRSAYGRGLVMEAAGGFNPYKFGLIGSSDSHNSSTAVQESGFTGGHGNADMTPEVRLDSAPSTLTASSLNFSASGLAAVWAEENTRESIFAALRRKETYATSGPRIRLRFFAGTGFPDDLAERGDSVTIAYERGVPMGADLAVPSGTAPSFYVLALRDPETAPLDRVQIVKTWVAAGAAQERIYDAFCSDGRRPLEGRCPDSGAEVDLTDCAISSDVGATELTGVWHDPDFDAEGRAAYYVRVLENPTCRWSTWDAIRTDVEAPNEVAPTLRERAWSSPIWISP